MGCARGYKFGKTADAFVEEIGILEGVSQVVALCRFLEAGLAKRKGWSRSKSETKNKKTNESGPEKLNC